MAQYKIDYKISATPVIKYDGTNPHVMHGGIGHSVAGGKRITCKTNEPNSVKAYTYTTTSGLTAIPGFVDRYDIHTLFVKIVSPVDGNATAPNLFIAMNWPIISPGDELETEATEYYTDDLEVNVNGLIVAPTSYYNTDNFYNNENFYLEGVDDCMLLRTRGVGGRDIFFRSTDVTGLCNIEILVGGDR